MSKTKPSAYFIAAFLTLVVSAGSLFAISLDQWDVPYEHPQPQISPDAPASSSSAPKEPVTCRIVDFGDDYQWRDGFPKYRNGATFQDSRGIDLDGDGKNNDSVAYCEFSLEKPFNQLPGIYDLYANNAIFYGGGVGFFHNKNPRLSECAINVNHNGLDDFNWHAYATERGVGERVFATWIWKKEDFLNRGDECPVSFDADSHLYVRVTRFWKSYDEGRFVVQNGDQFYISEFAFGNQPPVQGDKGGAPNNYQVYNVCPVETRWAEWNPEGPYHFDYHPDNLEFEDIDFDDVQATGWIIAKLEPTPGSCWVKWAAFEAHATVTRSSRPGETVQMIQPAPAVPFWMSTDEVDYLTWRKIYRWCVRNQWAHTPGYVFDQDGDMGTMDDDDLDHSPDEPVTDITWLDAVLWCNALSEYEGRTPCYYTDKDHTQVLRVVKERQNPDKLDWIPNVYCNPDADGYRLPTETEWAAASGVPAAQNMLGSVWEWVWTDSDMNASAADQSSRTALGGSAEVAAPAAGEIPFDGNGRTGFRVVRSTGGKWTPETATTVPKWTMKRGDIVAGSGTVNAPELNMIALPAGEFSFGDGSPLNIKVLPFYLAETELTFADWKPVQQWAEVNGYEFNYDGAMGSMADALHKSYSPNEPVTQISMFDAMLWCNALSEMKGMTPVYYEDAQKTKVLRRSNPFRHNMYVPDDPNHLRPNKEARDLTFNATVMGSAFIKWEADGYRLPTDFEWEYAAKADLTKHPLSYPSAGDKDFWVYSNSDGKTQPAGISNPGKLGFHDLMGNVFEFTSAPFKINPFDSVNPRSDDIYTAIKGGSYRIRDNREDLSHGMDPAQSQRLFVLFMVAPALNAYPEIGFRPARCDAGVQPVEKEIVPPVVLDIDTAAVDPLQGTMYRGNNRRTGYFPAEAPASEPDEAWRFATGGAVEASPVVVGDTVYVGSANGTFYALDRSSGDIRWQFKIPSGKAIRSSAAVYQNRIVYFVGNDGTLYALDAKTGQPVWRKPSAAGLAVQDFGMGTSPLIVDGTVFCNGQRVLTGFDAETGRTVWESIERKNNAAGLSAPTYGNGIIFFSFGSVGLAGIDIRTRQYVYADNLGGDTFQTTPACSDTHVFGAAGRGFCGYAAEPNRNGKEPALFETADPGWDRMHPLFSAPAIDADRMYAGNVNGTMTAVEMDSGDIDWSFEAEGPVYSAPAITDQLIVFGSEDGSVYALKKASGKEAWQVEVGKIGYSSPWIDDEGGIYIGTLDGDIVKLQR